MRLLAKIESSKSAVKMPLLDQIYEAMKNHSPMAVFSTRNRKNTDIDIFIPEVCEAHVP